MITFSHRGNFNKTLRFMNRVKGKNYLNILDRYGKAGVEALAMATPVDSGETAASWSYEITSTPTRTTISWINTHENAGVNIAVILQYGHGTGSGGYVAGIDYINPAMKPIFDKIAQEAWKEVTTA